MAAMKRGEGLTTVPGAALPLATTPFAPAHITLSAHTTATSASSSIRTILDVIDYNAAVNGRHRFCIQAEKDPGARNGDIALRTVTHAELKDALLRSVHWFRSHLLPPSHDTPVALLMDSDLTLLLCLLSLVALGVPVLVLSARLSASNIAALLTQTGASTIVISPRMRQVAEEAGSLSGRATHQQPFLVRSPPSYRDLLGVMRADLEREKLGRIASVGSTDERNVLVLHTSGTTGVPQPIWCSHRYLLGYATCHAFVDHGHTDFVNLSTLPLFHGFGLVPPALSISVGRPVCFPISPDPPTGQSLLMLMKAVNASSLMSVPSIIEDICRLPDGEGLRCLASQQFVASGGGPLKLSIAEEMAAAGVKIVNSFGNTEAGPLSLMFVPADDYDWHYFRLRKDYDIRLEELRNQEDDQKRFKISVKPFGWDHYFVIQDEMIGNLNRPTEDFRPVGRTDDLVVMATGEKVDPRILEAALFEDAAVRAAVVFGNDRSEIGILIEPAWIVPVDQTEHFKNSLWGIVLKANARMDAHCAVTSKDMLILVPTAGKVIPRSDKGSVLRRQTYDLFAPEIQQAYESLDAAKPTVIQQDLDYKRLEESVKALVLEKFLTGVSPEKLKTDTDLFELGMDSLQATRLRRTLASSLTDRADGKQIVIPMDFIYRNSSIAAICKHIRGESTTYLDREAIIARLVQEYACLKGLEDPLLEAPNNSPPPGHVVLLTGTTGHLGPHIFAEIVADPLVSRVYCLNRAQAVDSLERQKGINRIQRLEISASHMAKASFFQVDTSEPLLGLSHEEYAGICANVTHIIHNAWPVTFNRHVHSFAKQFQTIRQLVQIARSRLRDNHTPKLRLLFVSSIAVVGRTPIVTGKSLVAEVAAPSIHHANFLGYAEAKYVCEQLISELLTQYPDSFSAAVVRMGQLVGSSASRVWNSAEHFPAMVRASQRMRCLPELPGTHSWLPVDAAAKALREILLSDSRGLVFYHLENPNRQPWSHTTALLASHLRLDQKATVPLDDWSARVGADAAARKTTETELESNLLGKFLYEDFQRMSCGGVVLDMTNSRRECPSLISVDAVDDHSIMGYVEEWRNVGFLER